MAEAPPPKLSESKPVRQNPLSKLTNSMEALCFLREAQPKHPEREPAEKLRECLSIIDRTIELLDDNIIDLQINPDRQRPGYTIEFLQNTLSEITSEKIIYEELLNNKGYSPSKPTGITTDEEVARQLHAELNNSNRWFKKNNPPAPAAPAYAFCTDEPDGLHRALLINPTAEETQVYRKWRSSIPVNTSRVEILEEFIHQSQEICRHIEFLDLTGEYKPYIIHIKQIIDEKTKTLEQRKASDAIKEGADPVAIYNNVIGMRPLDIEVASEAEINSYIDLINKAIRSIPDKKSTSYLKQTERSHRITLLQTEVTKLKKLKEYRAECNKVYTFKCLMTEVKLRDNILYSTGALIRPTEWDLRTNSGEIYTLYNTYKIYFPIICYIDVQLGIIVAHRIIAKFGSIDAPTSIFTDIRDDFNKITDKSVKVIEFWHYHKSNPVFKLVLVENPFWREYEIQISPA